MMDYRELGLKVGIEIHQELDTSHKLFCKCPLILNTEPPDYTFRRILRPAQSELGEVDPAALFEFLKGKTIEYEARHESCCLVEMDEEPPGPLNPEALEIALQFILMTGGTPVDEVQVMRKTVVDGSNTGGFQRTCVVGLGGSVKAGGKTVALEQVALEEDAARKMGETEDTITYRLDRLGIPLIEITTAPEMETPREVYQVAKRIGSILRAMGRVRRGIGTIRQDVNISIRGGGIIEVKGAQELGKLETLVAYEAQRQAALLEIAEELKKRGARREDLAYEFTDVSHVFKGTESRIIASALKRGGVVLAVKLPGFHGLTGRELCPNRRLGTEFSEHASFKGGVKGIFHTDELPGYRITEEEVEALREAAGAGPDDAVVLVADEEAKCREALKAVVDRAAQAFDGVPAETRAANADGTTRFTRPRPGAARMYPETDIRPVKITPETLEALKAHLPEMPEEKLRRYQEEYGLNEKLATQLLDSPHLPLFEKLAAQGHPTTLLAVTLTEDLTKLRRDGVPVDNLSDEAVEEAFNLVREGVTTKEALPDLLKLLAEKPELDAASAVDRLGVRALSEDQVWEILVGVVEENAELVSSRGQGALGPLMGRAMARLRGRAQPQMVQRLLKKILRERQPPT